MNLYSDGKRWDERYTKDGPESFGTGPSTWLAAHEDLLLNQSKGKALDVACGNGRNSFVLAELGFDVDAVDISKVVIEWLEGEVAKSESLVRPRCDNIVDYDLPRETYQVIISFNFLERSIFSKLTEALSLGGLLVFETMTEDHIDVLGKKFNRKYVLRKDELRHSFPDLEILSYREEIVSEGTREAAVASLVARKA